MIAKPSKSARKREQLALQALGEKLIDLTPDQLRRIGLDQRLHEAVIAAKGMRAHGALRRQKQLIGKLMRDLDPAPVAAAIEAFGRSDRLDKRIFHEAEAWRDRIAGGDQSELDAYFEYIGHRNKALAQDVSALRAAPHAKARREAKRRIFRHVHGDLSQKMQT